MPAFWSGSISFGLVSIPVKLETAHRSRDISFNYLHRKCQQRINQRYYCPTCDEYVDRQDLVRGYEYEKDRYVILEPADFAQVEGEDSRNIEVIGFVDRADIRPVHLSRTYYLIPEEAASKGYLLLMKAMQDTGTMAVTRFVMRGKEYIGAIGSTDNGLILHVLFHQGEFKKLEDVIDLPDVELNKKEMDLARQIIENMREPFSEEMLTDHYRERLMEVVQQKIAGEPAIVAENKQPAKVVDLMEALKRSLDAATAKKPAARAGVQKTAGQRKAVQSRIQKQQRRKRA